MTTAVSTPPTPEYGLFGVAPGTDWGANPNAMRTISGGNTLFANAATTDDGDVWWEGLGTPPAHLTDWHGHPWSLDSATPAAHPNSDKLPAAMWTELDTLKHRLLVR